jgi:hypothetical protein
MEEEKVTPKTSEKAEPAETVSNPTINKEKVEGNEIHS